MDAEIIEKFDEQFSLVEGTPVLEDISSVYVRKDSIQDILSLNTLSKEVANKGSELAAKEEIIDGLKKDRNNLAEEIIKINDTQNIQEADSKLTNLHDLDKKIKTEEEAKEEIYAALTSLKNKYADLEASTKKMVDAMTEEYNAKAKEFTECTVGYIEKPSDKDYEHIHELAANLADYKKYNSFEDIYTNVEDKEEEKNEEKAVEAPEVEKAVVTELSEVKVDSLPEAEVAENKEEKDEEVAPSEPVKAEVTPIVEEKVAMPTFEELMEKAKEAEAQNAEKAEVTPIAEQKVEETKPEVTAEVPETPVAEVTPLATPEVKQEQELKIAILTSKNDKIAETDGAKVTGIKEVFANSKTVEEAKTLELSA